MSSNFQIQQWIIIMHSLSTQCNAVTQSHINYPNISLISINGSSTNNQHFYAELNMYDWLYACMYVCMIYF